jgi:hypothetical protein
VNRECRGKFDTPALFAPSDRQYACSLCSQTILRGIEALLQFLLGR